MKKQILLIFFAVIAIASCKKDDTGGTASFNLDKPNYYLTENIIIYNTSIGAEKYSWNFGDGSTSTSKTPTHSYTTAGNYKITLTVNGNSTVSVPVRVYNGKASFQIDNESSFAFPLFTYSEDNTQTAIDYQAYGNLNAGAISDTIFTANTDVYIGGMLNATQTFEINAPYTVTLFTHNILTFTNTTEIVIR